MKKRGRTVTFMKIIFLINVVILLTGISACAEQPYTKSAELICENVKVKIITKCFGDTVPSFPECDDQYFVFENQKTGQVLTKPAIGSIGIIKDAKGRTIGKSLNALATSWACVKGRTKSYIIVGYSTGGNCEECQWFEIYGLDGKSLATSKGRKIKQYKEEFIKTYDRLGLPKPWPGSSFTYIKLSRGNK